MRCRVDGLCIVCSAQTTYSDCGGLIVAGGRRRGGPIGGRWRRPAGRGGRWRGWEQQQPASQTAGGRICQAASRGQQPAARRPRRPGQGPSPHPPAPPPSGVDTLWMVCIRLVERRGAAHGGPRPPSLWIVTGTPLSVVAPIRQKSGRVWLTRQTELGVCIRILDRDHPPCHGG